MNHLTTLGVRVSASALAIAALAVAPVSAADFGGDCCADLEDRIAELEATTARKGNRKVSLSLTGHVNQMVMFWDDGHESNTYVVGNAQDQTNVQFTGDARVSADLSAGFQITIRVNDTLSGEVTQDDDDGDLSLTVWEAYWYLESKSFGKLSVGQAPRATDGVPEVDLSETGAAAYAGVQDIGGGLFLRRANGDVTGLAWGDLYSHYNGDTGNLVRYDTPEFAGFVVSASWGEDDIWDVSATYSAAAGGFKFEGAIGYTQITDAGFLDGDADDPDSNIVVGSASILHQPSGLNATIAAGRRSFDETVLDGDGVFRTPEDASYIYAKLGWIAKVSALGSTAFYGEYGHFTDYVSVSGDGAGALGFNPTNSRILGNDVDVWGLGVVQHIEAAEMQLYLGYRQHSADFDVLDNGATASVNVDDMQTFVAGGIISF